MNLNAEQEQAANSIDGVFVVIAGPGSGKTTTLIERYMRMLIRGIKQRDILNLTFTNAAASEMVKRVGLTNAESVFRTFHSFAIEILKKEREHLPFKLCDTVIPIGMEDYKLLFDLIKAYPELKNYRALRNQISEWKRNNVQPEEAIKKTEQNKNLEYYQACAYYEYEHRCRQEGWLDFDSLMREAVNLLEDNEEVRNRWKRKYISVDECQDTDTVQFRLLQLVFDGNIFAVGDENQLIYEWRSAQAGNLTNFGKKFPGAKLLFMGQNFRSTQKLVSFFKDILPEDNGIASRMMTENDHGIEPTITRYRDDQEEAVQTLRKIADPVNTAVIARTNRQLFLFQRICISRGIKYKILGKKDFFEENEVKKLLNLAKESRDMRPANEVLSDLIMKHNLLHIYRGSGNPMDSDPAENLNSIVKMAAGKGTIPEFLDRLRRLTHARKSAKGLTLSTVHQAKGREFDHVYVVGCSQGKMPHKEGEIGEERRIFFVACSRAAKTLNISFYGNASEFLLNHERFLNEYEPAIGEVSEDPQLVPSEG
jgi:superfamily I DNA/RNA helicase